MKLLKILLMGFSVGCATVERPDTNLCVINEPLEQLECYNLRTDYSDEGKITTDAKPLIIGITGLESVNKYICTDPAGFSELKAYITKLRKFNEQQ